MEHKFTRLQVMLVAGVLAVIAFILRKIQLATAFDVVGARPGAGIGFAIVTVLAVLAFAGYAWSLRGRKKYPAITSRSLPVLAVSAVAGILLLVGSMILAVRSQREGDLLVAALGALTAVSWGATATARYMGKKIPVAVLLLPAVYYVVYLICQFRFWTRDPVILDYCYDLFALICNMFALFHLGGYAFDKGSRRLTVFFAMSGMFFNAAALAGAELTEALGYLGAGLWLGANLWILLRPGKKRQTEE